MALGMTLEMTLGMTLGRTLRRTLGSCTLGRTFGRKPWNDDGLGQRDELGRRFLEDARRRCLEQLPQLLQGAPEARGGRSRSPRQVMPLNSRNEGLNSE